MGYTKRKCDNCPKEYLADNRNLKRGWGLCCSKSCAASKREKSKPGYDPLIVARNNRIREGKMTNDDFESLPYHRQSYLNRQRFGEDSPNIVVMDGVAYDEWDHPVYNYDPYDDCHPFDMDY